MLCLATFFIGSAHIILSKLFILPSMSIFLAEILASAMNVFLKTDDEALHELHFHFFNLKMIFSMFFPHEEQFTEAGITDAL